MYKIIRDTLNICTNDNIYVPDILSQVVDNYESDYIQHILMSNIKCNQINNYKEKLKNIGNDIIFNKPPSDEFIKILQTEDNELKEFIPLNDNINTENITLTFDKNCDNNKISYNILAENCDSESIYDLSIILSNYIKNEEEYIKNKRENIILQYEMVNIYDNIERYFNEECNYEPNNSCNNYFQISNMFPFNIIFGH